MKAPDAGGFRLGDVMILVAATAVGCSLFLDLDELKQVIAMGSRYRFSYYWSLFATLAYPFWWPWTFAATAIGLRSPRPSSRRLARRPGMVACVLVSVCSPFDFAYPLFLQYRMHLWAPGSRLPPQCLAGLPFQMAFLVFGAWMAQWWNGRWRPEPSAIDRFGRLLGFGWIAFYLGAVTCSVLQWL